MNFKTLIVYSLGLTATLAGCGRQEGTLKMISAIR